MELHNEKAKKANQAANDIGDAIAKTVAKIRPTVADKFDLDDQLITLAIAKAAVGVAADAASQATGMGTAACDELEGKLQDVVIDTMSNIPPGNTAPDA